MWLEAIDPGFVLFIVRHGRPDGGMQVAYRLVGLGDQTYGVMTLAVAESVEGRQGDVKRSNLSALRSGFLGHRLELR
jgi:hypothetical protein